MYWGGGEVLVCGEGKGGKDGLGDFNSISHIYIPIHLFLLLSTVHQTLH